MLALKLPVMKALISAYNSYATLFYNLLSSNFYLKLHLRALSTPTTISKAKYDYTGFLLSFKEDTWDIKVDSSVVDY